MIDDIKKTLWATADKLRANMDAAEYKHLVLGLIFLKYISDTFRARRTELTARFADPADEYFLEGATRAAAAALSAAELEDRDYATTTARPTSSGFPRQRAGKPSALRPSSPTSASASTTRWA